MNISIINNSTFNASSLQNNQQRTINIYKFKKNGKRFYLCPFMVCDDIFTRKDSLADHIAAHENKRAHSCDICSKNFNTKRALNRHKKIHKDKKFTCYTCNRSFTYKKSLQIHNNSKSHNRNINNIPIDHSPYKPDPCITDAKNYSVEVAMKEQSRLNHESQNIYQDNNQHDPSKLPDSAELVIQEEDYSSDIEKHFNENNLLDIEISYDEDIESLTAGLNYDDIVAHYL
jgi:hypothetical protein